MSEAPVFRINLVRDPNNRNAQLYIQDVYELVEYEIEVSYEDVVGVQRRGLHSFDIMIKREEYAKYIDILNGFKDRKIELSNGKIVTVINPYERLTYVVVRGFPMHWEIEKMNRIISYYGEIRQVINERYSAKAAEGTRYDGKWNGNIKYKMKLRTRIPCGITVCDERLQVYYPEQEQACRKCDLRGHKWFNCKTPFRERRNIFNMEDFPELDEEIIRGSILRNRNTEENENGNENEKENENDNENGKENDKDTEMDSHEENTGKEEDQADRDTLTRDMEQELENEVEVKSGEITKVKERSEKNDIENQDEIHLATLTQEIDSHENREIETDTEYEELQLIRKTQEINLKEKQIKDNLLCIEADFHHRDISQVLNKAPMEPDAEKRGYQGQEEKRGKTDLDFQKGELNLDITDMLTVEMGINADIDSQVITPGQRIVIDEEENIPKNTDITKKKKRMASSEDEISDSFCGFVAPLNFKEDDKNTEDTKSNSKENHERDKKKIRKEEHGKNE